MGGNVPTKASLLTNPLVDAYQAVLDAMPDPAVLLAPAGQVVVANQRFGRFLATGSGQLQGVVFESLLEPADRAKFERLVGNPNPDPAGASDRIEVQFLRATNPRAEISASLLRASAGLKLLVVHSLASGGEATAAEVQRLKEMSEFRARFINIAAHELKTPLTPIRIQLQILQNYLQGAPEKVGHSLGVLSRSVDRLNALMEDVLDAARIQASRLTLRPKPVSLTSLVQEAIESYTAMAHEVGITLRGDLKPDVNVAADRARLMQVLNNLLSNGIKFTPPGGHLDVHLSQNSEWAVLRVLDSGRGMSQEQLSKLFQPFTQVHPDLEATRKGTGLGLFITKSIIDQHKGRIEIYSGGQDHGTEVAVWLPISADQVHHEPPPPLVRRSQLRDRLRELV